MILIWVGSLPFSYSSNFFPWNSEIELGTYIYYYSLFSESMSMYMYNHRRAVDRRGPNFYIYNVSFPLHRYDTKQSLHLLCLHNSTAPYFILLKGFLTSPLLKVLIAVTSNQKYKPEESCSHWRHVLYSTFCLGRWRHNWIYCLGRLSFPRLWFLYSSGAKISRCSQHSFIWSYCQQYH